jgi:hypothetical protein
MKKTIVLINLLALLFIAANVQAQTLKVPKIGDTASLTLPTDKAGFAKDFLSSLDAGKDLGIPADKLLSLTGKNKSYVDDIVGILGGSGSNESKLSALTGKKTAWKSAVTSLLGESTAGKYFSKVDKQLGSLKLKYQVAKLFL